MRAEGVRRKNKRLSTELGNSYKARPRRKEEMEQTEKVIKAGGESSSREREHFPRRQ